MFLCLFVTWLSFFSLPKGLVSLWPVLSREHSCSLHLPVVLTQGCDCVTSDNVRQHPCCTLRKRKKVCSRTHFMVPVSCLASLVDASVQWHNNNPASMYVVRPLLVVVYYLMTYVAYLHVESKVHRLTRCAVKNRSSAKALFISS
jgi:hypothetical protein